MELSHNIQKSEIHTDFMCLFVLESKIVNFKLVLFKEWKILCGKK
jgi:hypothetical protein